MQNDLEILRKNTFEALQKATSREGVMNLHHHVLGRKGSLTELLKKIKDLSETQKRVMGRMANELKKELDQKFLNRTEELKRIELNIEKTFFDTSLPGEHQEIGRLHPLTKFIREIEETFTALNFQIVEGPEVEDDYHNFTALNIAADHPARDSQDTFLIRDLPYLLRTQTSSVQIRHMESHKPPIRVICPGRVFRKDDVDATHSPMFHQFEGLMVDRHTNLSHLKGVLTIALRRLIDENLEIRFRSHFFPFVEPGLEADVTCFRCQKKGCPLCKYSGWIEMLGCGMVHPNVLMAVGIDPNEYQGFAFGAGIDRLLMLRYKINDIRLFFENDPRFLEQFPLLS